MGLCPLMTTCKPKQSPWLPQMSVPMQETQLSIWCTTSPVTVMQNWAEQRDKPVITPGPVRSAPLETGTRGICINRILQSTYHGVYSIILQAVIIVLGGSHQRGYEVHKSKNLTPLTPPVISFRVFVLLLIFWNTHLINLFYKLTMAASAYFYSSSKCNTFKRFKQGITSLNMWRNLSKRYF